MAWTANEWQRQVMCPAAGTFKSLRILLDAAPGLGTSYTFTLRINGNPTTLTIQLSDAETTDVDLVNAPAVSAGDLVALECAPAGGPAAVNCLYSVIFEGTVAGESVIMGSVTAFQYTPGANRYIALSGNGPWFQVNTFMSWQTISTPGTMKNLYIQVRTAPGAGQSVTFTVQKDGVDTALTVTLNNLETTKSDLVNSVAFVATDNICLRVTPTAGAAASECYHGAVYVATTDGESLILGLRGDPDEANTRYGTPHCSWGTWNLGPEAFRDRMLVSAMTIRNLCSRYSTAPGVGNDWDETLFVNGIASLLTTNATGAQQDVSDLVNDIAVNDGDVISLELDPTGPPANSNYHNWGMTGFIEPGWAHSISGVTNPSSVNGVLRANISSIKGVA
jgi:hypothetical protein